VLLGTVARPHLKSLDLRRHSLCLLRRRWRRRWLQLLLLLLLLLLLCARAGLHVRRDDQWLQRRRLI